MRETRPVGVEGALVVLGIGAHLPFHLAQLQEDDRLTAVVTAAAAELLGGEVTIAYRPVNGETEPVAEAEEEIPARTPDKNDLAEAGDGGINATDLVVDGLNGEVVED